MLYTNNVREPAEAELRSNSYLSSFGIDFQAIRGESQSEKVTCTAEEINRTNVFFRRGSKLIKSGTSRVEPD